MSWNRKNSSILPVCRDGSPRLTLFDQRWKYQDQAVSSHRDITCFNLSDCLNFIWSPVPSQIQATRLSFYFVFSKREQSLTEFVERVKVWSGGKTTAPRDITKDFSVDPRNWSFNYFINSKNCWRTSGISLLDLWKELRIDEKDKLILE